MSAFLESGRSDHSIRGIPRGRFRPEAAARRYLRAGVPCLLIADSEDYPMRIIIAAFFLATIALPTQTRSNALECVDPDIVTAFLTRWYSPTRLISREMPEEFAALNTPKGFYFIGSAVADYGKSVAFRTDIDPSNAESAVVASLETIGWRRLPQRESGSTGTGFQSTALRPRSVSLCRDDDLPMYVSTRDEASGTYVVLSTNNQQSGCNLSETLHGRMASDFLQRGKMSAQ